MSDTPEYDDPDEVDLGEDPVESYGSLSAIERKYRSQMRQIFPTKIDLPMFTLAQQIDAQIDLRPDFQRRDRWSTAKRSRFIESIIMNVPVPPVFLGEEEYGKYVVLDGRQRLTAAYKFLTDSLRLSGLEVWSELNGLKYSQLKKKGLSSTIERRFLPAILLTRESSPEVKYEVFERLNTGGVPASQMEVRNAVFPGRFNQTLHKLSKIASFRRLWGIPVDEAPKVLEKNGLYRDMRDLELVLRFFALGEEGLKGMTYKELLSDHMSIRNREYSSRPELAQFDQARFERAVGNAEKIFGLDAFRRPDQPDVVEKKRTRSAPYADAVMHGLVDVEPALLEDGPTKQRIVAAFARLFDNAAFKQAVSTGTNGDKAVRDRVGLARAAVVAAIAGG